MKREEKVNIFIHLLKLKTQSISEYEVDLHPVSFPCDRMQYVILSFKNPLWHRGAFPGDRPQLRAGSLTVKWGCNPTLKFHP